jgi:hypothetical protein
MRSHLFSLIFGLALGILIFWLPSAFSGGSFALPILFFAGPWFLDAVPYLLLFAAIFAIFAAAYRAMKRSFPVSLINGAWMLGGIYIALTFLYYFTAAVMHGGTFVL